MRKIDQLLAKYGESHQHDTNKAIHWICVPSIMFSLFGLLMSIPFPYSTGWLVNWASLSLILALLYYLRLSIPMFLGFVLIGGAMILGNGKILEWSGFDRMTLFGISAGIFLVAWIGQFIGHRIEGKKPSFLEDLQFLLIGPAWLLHFIYKKAGIAY
jgi:uncharacterized membrane protein YGL010W